ncbi:MAG: permease-like cell division protein FtsX [Coriobacteriales bacterium]|jgi:cell division transport system permease protein|nr:permease-like cell division protein FtsX [Coriobacteriales bacterium]
MHSLLYFIREALSNSRRNFGTTFGAVVTIFLSLLVIGIFTVASLIVDRIVYSVEQQVSISIFLSDDAAQTDVNTLISYATELEGVAKVTYVSKEEALERFKEMSSPNPEITEQLDGNPLPASVEIEMSEPEKITAVAEQTMANPLYAKIIESPDDPDRSIRYGQKIVDQMFAVTNVIRIVCMVLVVLLIFVALVFINNTIRLAILARRKEIAIMRLVGASNGFIRGPFLMEGALQALVGSGLAILCIHGLVSFLIPKMNEFFAWLPIDYASMQIWAVYLILLGVGLLIGLFGSAWAMRRYLRV